MKCVFGYRKSLFSRGHMKLPKKYAAIIIMMSNIYLKNIAKFSEALEQRATSNFIFALVQVNAVCRDSDIKKK